jgi:MarR family transcriptional regulator, organic hydroperoxide resistance regulator
MEYNKTAKYFSYLDEDQDLWMLLTHARYAIYRSREKELFRLGISPEQAGILFVVQALGNNPTPSDISRFIIRQPHTVSSLIERMTAKGLVKKTHDPERKNLVRVSLTEKGQRIYDLSTGRRSIHRILSVLSGDERARLRELLVKMQARARLEIGLDREKYPPVE